MNRTTLPPATRQHLARLLAGGASSDADLSANRSAPPDSEQIGLVTTHPPGLPHALWLRGGSPDAAAMMDALDHAVSRLSLESSPRRIIEIGAGCGYRSVALAHAFPDAMIASVEPFPVNARLHALNTLPWRRITGLRSAISRQVGRFTTANDAQTGLPVLRPDPNGGISGMSLQDVYRLFGWDHVDLLLIDQRACWDPEGELIAEAPTKALLTALRLVDQAHERIVRAALPPVTQPRPIAVFDLGGPPAPVTRDNIAAGHWAYFPIGETSFRLHPNPPGTNSPRLTVTHDLSGQSQFVTQLRVNHPGAHPVRFRIILSSTTGLLASADTILPGNMQQALTVDFPATTGPVRVEFSTEMADQRANTFAWAEFIAPILK